MATNAKEAVRQQLGYWTGERESARLASNFARIAECEHFIEQLRAVLVALEAAGTG